jgi:hypothetical protein
MIQWPHMGGNSTSHAVSRGKQHAGSPAFDLHSWQGLTAVLKLGKESLKEVGQYAEFRNLVLSYAQNGGDATLRKQIDAIVATFRTSGESVSVSPVESVAPSVQTTPAPVLAPQQTEREVHADVEQLSQSLDAKPHILEESSAPAHAKMPAQRFGIQRAVPQFKITSSNTQHVSDVPTSVQAPVLPCVPAESPAETSVKEHSPSSPSATSSPAQAADDVTRERFSTFIPHADSKSVDDTTMKMRTPEEYKARIAEIKRMVHSHVGNPVTLMDTHNELGRQYMATLLSTLKATMSGSPLNPEVELAKLEKVTEELIHEHTHKPVEETSVASAAVASTQSVFPKEPQVPPNKEPESVQDTQASQAVAQPVSVEIVEDTQKDHPQSVHTESSPLSEAAPTPLADDPHESAPAILPVPEDTVVPSVTNSESEVDQPTPKEPMTSESPIEAVPSVQPSTETPPTHSPELSVKEHVAVAIPTMGAETPSTPHIPVQHREPSVPPKIILNTPPGDIKQADLVTPQINEALAHLLDEWNIFAGSGFFGTGPGGTHHPLYKQLSVLSMGEVLAGRWEKSDPKIVRSIKQYVDAWRHEQGIAYTINETFEHYLRRVIQRILKRQHILD